MDYKEVLSFLEKEGFTRIERDDRIYDILSFTENREKGVELWEKSGDEETLIIRLRIPYVDRFATLFKVPSQQLQSSLRGNTPFALNDSFLVALGEESILGFFQK